MGCTQIHRNVYYWLLNLQSLNEIHVKNNFSLFGKYLKKRANFNYRNCFRCYITTRIAGFVRWPEYWRISNWFKCWWCVWIILFLASAKEMIVKLLYFLNNLKYDMNTRSLTGQKFRSCIFPWYPKITRSSIKIHSKSLRRSAKRHILRIMFLNCEQNNVLFFFAKWIFQLDKILGTHIFVFPKIHFSVNFTLTSAMIFILKVFWIKKMAWKLNFIGKSTPSSPYKSRFRIFGWLYHRQTDEYTKKLAKKC